jgi:hypothetical protein
MRVCFVAGNAIPNACAALRSSLKSGFSPKIEGLEEGASPATAKIAGPMPVGSDKDPNHKWIEMKLLSTSKFLSVGAAVCALTAPICGAAPNTKTPNAAAAPSAWRWGAKINEAVFQPGGKGVVIFAAPTASADADGARRSLSLWTAPCSALRKPCARWRPNISA